MGGRRQPWTFEDAFVGIIKLRQSCGGLVKVLAEPTITRIGAARNMMFIIGIMGLMSLNGPC